MLEIKYTPQNDRLKLWNGEVVDIGDPSNFVAMVSLYRNGPIDYTYQSANAILKAIKRPESERYVLEGTNPTGLPPIGWLVEVFWIVRRRLTDLEKNPSLSLTNPLEPSYVPMGETIKLPDGKDHTIRDVLEFYANVNSQFEGSMYYEHFWADRVRMELGLPTVNGDDTKLSSVVPVGWCVELMRGIAKKVTAIMESKKNWSDGRS